MIDKIKKFTIDDKNNLLSKTFYVLPDNPSDKHFSPSQIRKKGYEGYLVLFEFLNSVIDAINENVDLSNEDIEAINANITTLQSYFSNGIALKAIADKNGNDIVATYETKADASSKLANAKLYADGKVSDEATARASTDADLEARKVNISDIVDGLNDTSTNKPLSANMGKVLKGMIDAIISILSSDDTFLDTLQEIVNYIKDNKSLIDSITITKVNVSDIIDNLTSEIANKPVSAKQAFILKGMIDTLTAIVNTKANSTDVYDKNEIDAKINGLIFADIDTDFSLTSTNPIQNKVISKQIKDINYTIMTMKEELFETVLSEIDYKVDYATIYPIPDTLSDNDGTHRVVYSDTQLKEIEGNSVAFNQLLPISTLTNRTVAGITFTNNDNGSITIQGTATAQTDFEVFGNLQRSVPFGHKVLLTNFSNPSSSTYFVYDAYESNLGAITNTPYGYIKTKEGSATIISPRIRVMSGTVISTPQTLWIKYVDLTQMFGAGNEPTTVAEFNRIFPNNYYQYNAGEIRSTIIKEVRIRNSKLATVPLNKIGVVDLGTLEWRYTSETKRFSTNSIKSSIKYEYGSNNLNLYCKNYSASSSGDKVIWGGWNGEINVMDSSYTDVTTFTQAMNGVYLFYELKTSQETIPQAVIDEFITKTIQIPQTELPSAGSVHDTIKLVEGNVVAGQQRYNMVRVSRVDSVDLGTLGWVYVGTSYNAYAQLPNAKKVSSSVLSNMLCSNYKVYKEDDITAQTKGISFANVLIVKDSSLDGKTAEEIKTAMSGVMLNYEKAEPTETTLATDLTFEEVSAIIEQGGSIETIFEIVSPNLKTAFVVNKAIVS